MSQKYVAAIVIYFIALGYFEVEVSAKIEKDLWRHLFQGQNYDKLFRPVQNPKTAVSVSVGLVPIKMMEVSNYWYKVDTWFIVKWKDEYLTWNSSDFDNIEQIIVPVSKVWSPNLSLYPSNFENPSISNVTSNVVIRFNGNITWMTPNSILRNSNKEYPNCIISIISWDHDVSEMDIDINSQVNETMIDVMVETSKELRQFSWSEQPHPIVHFTLKVPQ